MLQSEPDNQAVGQEAPALADEPIPVEFYQWLYSIEKDVRVWDMTPNEIVRLRAALRHHESPTLDAVQREAGEGLAQALGRLHDNLSSAPPEAVRCFVSLDDHRTILANATLKHDLERQEAENVALRRELEAAAHNLETGDRFYMCPGLNAAAIRARTFLSTKGADHAEQG